MLQIITGRFFTSDDLIRTPQQTVLYSNFRAHAPIETIVGSYTPAGRAGDVATGVYAVEQRLEARSPDGSMAVVAAVGPESLAEDFAALMSFCLEISCALDPAVIARLTQSTRPPLATGILPRALIPQYFERELDSSQITATALSTFVSDLVRLERKRYKAVLRAIRRYVVALHRIGDDLSIAYVLLVAAIESLAAQFDDFDATWSDFDIAKRTKIDRALEGSAPDVRKAVQSAILEIEHVALGRRFREFALAHLPASFFREEAVGREGAAPAGDVPRALGEAYGLRSRLVHRLEELPSILLYTAAKRDIVLVDQAPMFTFAGLARVVRRVIMQHVEISQKLDFEDFNYRLDLPGTMSLPMAPRYWIWRSENYNTQTSRRFLGGFLAELEGVLMRRRTGLTDISGVLETIEHRLPGVVARNRRPMMALYLLFHRHMAPEHHRPEAEAFLEQHVAVLDEPSIESLVCHAILCQPTEWSLQQLNDVNEAYRDQRFHKSGLKLPPVLEAALNLHIAEELRDAGDQAGAARFLARVVEDMPGDEVLLTLEQQFAHGEAVSLNWRDVLLPLEDEPPET